MHRSYIADIERGARNVTLRSVANLAKALQVSVLNLVTFATDRGELAPADPISGPGGGPGKILLIEDSETDAAMTLRAFKRAHVTNPIRLVRTAEAGLDYLLGTGRFAKQKPAPPELILLDLNLPKMSGLDFLRRIKSDERTHDIPVIILTVSRSDIMIIECGRLGAENFIVKPLGIESFVRLISKLNLNLTVGVSNQVKTPDRSK